MERCKARQQGVFRYIVANYFAGSGLMTRNLKKTTAPAFLIQENMTRWENQPLWILKKYCRRRPFIIDHAGHFARVENEKQVNEFFEQVGKDLK